MKVDATQIHPSLRVNIKKLLKKFNYTQIDLITALKIQPTTLSIKLRDNTLSKEE